MRGWVESKIDCLKVRRSSIPRRRLVVVGDADQVVAHVWVRSRAELSSTVLHAAQSIAKPAPLTASQAQNKPGERLPCTSPALWPGDVQQLVEMTSLVNCGTSHTAGKLLTQLLA